MGYREEKMKYNAQGNALRKAWPLLLSATCSTDLDDIPLDYHQVKASYLLNLLRFIQWPDDVCSPDGRLHMSICGAATLDAFYALQGIGIGGRRISVRRIKHKDLFHPLEQCQILVISSDVPVMTVPIARGLLTVGETEGFTASGGIVNLLAFEGRVRFQLNEAVAQACGLVIHSKLLNLQMR
jgi:hypothetical protein